MPSITGGLGADQLIGGQGNDTLVHTATNESTPAAYDTIFDFEEAGNSHEIASPRPVTLGELGARPSPGWSKR